MRSFEGAQWFALSKLSISDLPSYGEIPAAYAFRHGKTKDVLYVGGTSCLHQRLFGNYLGGTGGSTTKRIHAHLFDEGYISVAEVTWFRAEDHKSRETDLQKEYAANHNGKRPPWSGSYRRKK